VFKNYLSIYDFFTSAFTVKKAVKRSVGMFGFFQVLVNGTVISDPIAARCSSCYFLANFLLVPFLLNIYLVKLLDAFFIFPILELNMQIFKICCNRIYAKDMTF